MKVLISGIVAAVLLATPVAADASNRDITRPSRSQAPARFGTVQYSQWYAQQAASMRYGWDATEFAALKKIWYHESGWNHRAVNRSSGAWGIPQSLPATKMRKFGSDYRTNPETQIDWGLWYIKVRYGSPKRAWAFWRSHNWY